MKNAELLMRREIVTANSCIISLKKELKRKHTLSGLSHSEIKKIIARHEAQIKRIENRIPFTNKIRRYKMENINLVRKIAWEFHYKTGIPFKELLSEAITLYLESQLTRGKVKKGINNSPYYSWVCIRNGLINFCIKEQSLKYLEIDYLQKGTNPIPFFELYDSFPAYCQEIIDIILKSRQEFACLMPKEARGLVVEKLRELGWSWSKIWDSIREIKQVLYETPQNCILN